MMVLTPVFSMDLTSASHVRNMLSALMTVWPLTATVATVSRPSQRRTTWSASARKSASTWKSREYCQSFWETQRVFSSLSRQSMGGIFPALRRSRWTTPGTVAGRVRSVSSCLTCHEPLSESVFMIFCVLFYNFYNNGMENYRMAWRILSSSPSRKTCVSKASMGISMTSVSRATVRPK